MELVELLQAAVVVIVLLSPVVAALARKVKPKKTSPEEGIQEAEEPLLPGPYEDALQQVFGSYIEQRKKKEEQKRLKKERQAAAKEQKHTVQAGRKMAAPLKKREPARAASTGPEVERPKPGPKPPAVLSKPKDLVMDVAPAIQAEVHTPFFLEGEFDLRKAFVASLIFGAPVGLRGHRGPRP
jgi:hypothetical protein